MTLDQQLRRLAGVDWLAPVRAWPGLCRYEAQMPALIRTIELRGRPGNESVRPFRNPIRGSDEAAGGWGTGTTPMPGTPQNTAPAWMPRRRAR